MNGYSPPVNIHNLNLGNDYTNSIYNIFRIDCLSVFSIIAVILAIG